MRNILLSFCLACLASAANATTIDFEEFAPAQGYVAITSKGFTLTSTGSGAYPPDYGFADTSGNVTYGWCPDCTLTLEDSTGDLFSIFSASLATPDSSFEIKGYLAGGGTVQTTFFSTGFNFSTVVFGSEWMNLERIEFGSGGVFQVADDIVVSAIPVPPALLLFGSAIAGLIGCRRRAQLTR